MIQEVNNLWVGGHARGQNRLLLWGCAAVMGSSMPVGWLHESDHFGKVCVFLHDLFLFDILCKFSFNNVPFKKSLVQNKHNHPSQ